LVWLNVLLLTSIAVLLAGPVTLALARAAWPQRNPRIALLLWQAIGLAGGTSLLFAGVSLSETGLPHHSLSDLLTVPTQPSAVGPLGWIGGVLTVLIALWLLGVTARSGRNFLRTLKANRLTVTLIGESVTWPLSTSDHPLVAEKGHNHSSIRTTTSGEHEQLIHVLPFSIPSAYCIGGVRPKVVLTAAALTSLTDRELRAVIAHERAHAHFHHDFVIQPFVAWHKAFPFLNPTSSALEAVESLVEIHADDSARKDAGLTALTSAITAIGSLQSQPPGTDRSAIGKESALRLQHLADAADPLRPMTQASILLAAFAVAAMPFAILLVH
jgi:Zn-dependent protease with chaperone function